MRLETLTTFPDSQKWAERWEALVARAALSEPFVTWGWMRAAAQFDREAQPLLICGYVAEGSGERLVAIAPFARRRIRNLGRRRTALEMLGSCWGDYNDVIAEPEYHAEFISRVAEQIAAIIPDACVHACLENLPEDSPTLQTLMDRACAQGLTVELQQCDVGMALQIAGTDPAALDGLLKKERLVRKMKTLARTARLEFRVVREAAEMRDCLRRLCRWHTARYLLNGQPSIFDAEAPGSLCQLLELTISEMPGAACLPALFLDDEPVALTLAFEHRGALLTWVTSFDVGITGTSPGEMLVFETARYCRREGLHKLDFGRGSEGYKSRFTNSERRIYRLLIHRGSAAATVSSALARARAWAKRRPELWDAAVRLRGIWQLLRLEAQRTGLSRAILDLLGAQTRALLFGQVIPDSGAQPEALPELPPRRLVDVVLKYRRDLPSWEFRKAYELLRQGEQCRLVIEDDRLRQIVPEHPTRLKTTPSPLTPVSEISRLNH
jgi:CelD/BcsL family acetyltransferase involved in cellulose biosynthesis